MKHHRKEKETGIAAVISSFSYIKQIKLVIPNLQCFILSNQLQ